MWEELEGRDYGWRGLPRYALGVSSGGAMALVLAQEFALQVGTNFHAAACSCLLLACGLHPAVVHAAAIVHAGS